MFRLRLQIWRKKATDVIESTLQTRKLRFKVIKVIAHGHPAHHHSYLKFLPNPQNSFRGNVKRKVNHRDNGKKMGFKERPVDGRNNDSLRIIFILSVSQVQGGNHIQMF